MEADNWTCVVEQCLICEGKGKVTADFYMTSTFPLPKEPLQECKTCEGFGWHRIWHKEKMNGKT